MSEGMASAQEEFDKIVDDVRFEIGRSAEVRKYFGDGQLDFQVPQVIQQVVINGKMRVKVCSE